MATLLPHPQRCLAECRGRPLITLASTPHNLRSRVAARLGPCAQSVARLALASWHDSARLMRSQRGSARVVTAQLGSCAHAAARLKPCVHGAARLSPCAHKVFLRVAVAGLIGLACVEEAGESAMGTLAAA